jgi:hypothetical protein
MLWLLNNKFKMIRIKSAVAQSHREQTISWPTMNPDSLEYKVGMLFTQPVRSMLFIQVRNTSSGITALPLYIHTSLNTSDVTD